MSVRTLVTNKNVFWWGFSPMIGAIVTGVTLVITINQLILSEELVSLGDKRDRMERSIEFRTDVESRLDDPVSPADPASFMYGLLDAVRDRTDELDAAVGDVPTTTSTRRSTTTSTASATTPNRWSTCLTTPRSGGSTYCSTHSTSTTRGSSTRAAGS